MSWRNLLLILLVVLTLSLATYCSTAEASTVWTFDPPVTREDDTPLTNDEISHYQVELDGMLQSNLSGTASSITIAGLDSSTDHCLILRTVDIGGRMSRDSNVACKPGDTIIIVPPPPPPINEVSPESWVVTGYSSYENDNWLMRPEYLFNRGDPSQHALYHSRYSPTEAQPPHWVSIDMGDTYRVTGFRLQHRKDMGNGSCADYEVHLSPDGQTWALASKGVVPLQSGELPLPLTPLSSSLFETADGSMSGRYVRLTCLSEHDGGNQAAVDEFFVEGSLSILPEPLIMLE